MDYNDIHTQGPGGYEDNGVTFIKDLDSDSDSDSESLSERERKDNISETSYGFIYKIVVVALLAIILFYVFRINKEITFMYQEI